MGTTSSTPDVPGAAGMEQREGENTPASLNEGPAATGPWRTGAAFETGIEEDWTSMATGDPAFWLKD